MKDMAEAFSDKIVFTIPIFGGISISEALLTSWGIMVFLLLLSMLCVRNLKIFPKKVQTVVEILVNWINSFFTENLGENGKQYIPLLGTMLLFIVSSNLCGLFGLTPPTKSLSVAAGLALISITLVIYSFIKRQGVKRWLKSYKEPMAVVTPFNILEIIIRPLSLCLRLFGNVIGAYIIMELIKALVPVGIPLIFSMFFDVFDGILQAYVFVFLTSIYMSEGLEDPEEGDEKKPHKRRKLFGKKAQVNDQP